MHYRERLVVPLGWWLIGLMFGLSFVVALGAWLGPWWAVGSAIVAAALIGVALVRYSVVVVSVEDAGLRVGRAYVPWAFVGDITDLDATAAHDRLGPRADARAFVVTRPYLAEAVEVSIEDPADPHPYWLVGSRHAKTFAREARTARDAARANAD